MQSKGYVILLINTNDYWNIGLKKQNLCITYNSHVFLFSVVQNITKNIFLHQIILKNAWIHQTKTVKTVKGGKSIGHLVFNYEF